MLKENKSNELTTKEPTSEAGSVQSTRMLQRMAAMQLHVVNFKSKRPC